ncbi:hypothetical protein AX15_002377 [Amanita polypyramis BW_CC]|nr:hypothetical protein AX15_002377 [Amanita polypyramis BW_CC]
MSDTVIREVSKNVWTFSKPFSRYGVVPIGGRSTAIKMKDGGVWVLASTPLNAETRQKLDQLGPVRYIVGADAVHRLYLSEFKSAYPDAKLIAPQAALLDYHDKNLKFNGVWGRDPPDTEYGFEDEAYQTLVSVSMFPEEMLILFQFSYFSRFRNKDVAFFHTDSKSLIEADLLFNLPCKEQYSKVKPLRHTHILGAMAPSTWLHAQFTWRMGEDKGVMRRDVKTVDSWDFERIIPCHGDVIEKDAKRAWRDAFRYYYD